MYKKNTLVYLKGDIFSSPAEIIVNPVNTAGVMGKGLATEFKKKYPEMFKKYKQFCAQKIFPVGQLYIYSEADYKVLLFPTKKHSLTREKALNLQLSQNLAVATAV